MAAKLRKREEIPAQYKWDLSHIYPDDAAWEAALADVLASGKNFAAWEGKVAENPRQAIREYFDLNQQAEPVPARRNGQRRPGCAGTSRPRVPDGRTAVHRDVLL